MSNSAQFQARAFKVQPALTTGFKSSLFTLYRPRVRDENRALCKSTDIADITPLSININCPTTRVEDYPDLIRRELQLRAPCYDSRQLIESLWWHGSPLAQLTPEAITELCYRISCQFPNQREGATRGMAVTPMDLYPATLALLKGLDFNALKLHIDASVASDDRSLSKTETALSSLADYKAFKLSCAIKFSDESHQGYMERLLVLLEFSNCLAVEFNYSKLGPIPLVEKQACLDQLSSVSRHFADSGWLQCGNNAFFSPRSGEFELHRESNLGLDPWGYGCGKSLTRIGFGAGALSFSRGVYRHNSANIADYRTAIETQSSPVDEEFSLPAEHEALFKQVHSLLCYHRLPRAEDLPKTVRSTLQSKDWFIETASDWILSPQGILQLPAVASFLISHTR